MIGRLATVGPMGTPKAAMLERARRLAKDVPPKFSR